MEECISDCFFIPMLLGEYRGQIMNDAIGTWGAYKHQVVNLANLAVGITSTAAATYNC